MISVCLFQWVELKVIYESKEDKNDIARLMSQIGPHEHVSSNNNLFQNELFHIISN